MDDISAYIKSITKYSLFSPEEEKKFTEEYYASKDEALKHKIVNSNLRLVIKIACKYNNPNKLDLIQEGNMGLLRAVELFNPYAETKFSYYATFWIKAKILKYIMNSARPVKFATTARDRKLFFALIKRRNKLNSDGMVISNEELAKELDVSVADITRFDSLFQPTISLDKTLHQHGDKDRDYGVYLPDRLDSERNEEIPSQLFEQLELRTRLENALKDFSHGLNRKQREVLKRRYLKYDPDTLEEIGETLVGRSGKPVTRQRIQQIDKDVKTRLARFLTTRQLGI